MHIQIKSWLDEGVCWEGEANNIRHAMEQAVRSGANLNGADLAGANLNGADLAGANLNGARLAGANLDGANLIRANLNGANLADARLAGANLNGANLNGANLNGARLAGANLIRANLNGARLAGANLIRANLNGANLADANLNGANLADANLDPIRDDLWAVLSAQPAEVQGLRDAINEGRIDGSTYEGRCACLVGTLANVCDIDYKNFPLLRPNSSRPAERFFLMISPGDTPDKCQAAKIALDWVDQWLRNMRSAFTPSLSTPS